MIVKEKLAASLAEALRKAQDSGAVSVKSTPSIQFDVPPSAELGDYSSDLALVLARDSGAPAVRLAHILAEHLRSEPDLVERVDVSNAGFINLHLRAGWLHEALAEIRTRRGDFGKNDSGGGAKVQVEFVSAYPTAPLSVLHGRGAATGDALANVLTWNGWDVTREFYVNDAGSRFERFGRSVEAEYLRQLGREGVRTPVDGFTGEYVVELVRQIRERVSDRYLASASEERVPEMARLGRDLMLEQHRDTLAALGVQFDEWRCESELLHGGALDEALDRLREKDLVYEADGATWLRATALGDEVDRPLRRSNGETTYLAGDLAYHLDKFRRGFERVVDIWGPDHETYVHRTLMGIEGLGYSRQAVEILVLPPVTVKIDGRVVETASAGGNNLLLAEVIEEVGRSCARFFYLVRGSNTPLEFDLDLARLASPQNPVYRVQHAYRVARHVLEQGSTLPPAETPVALESVAGGEALGRRLADFADEVRSAAREMDPSRITRYAVQIADLLEPVLDSPESGDRLALVDVALVVLTSALEIIGCLPEEAG